MSRAQRGMTFDAGVLIALDRGDARMWLQIDEGFRLPTRPVVPAPVLAQVWRSGRQANLGRALAALVIEQTDDELARRAGELCAMAGTADAIDAIVVASAARRGDVVVTGDVLDLARLAAHTPNVAIRRI